MAIYTLEQQAANLLTQCEIAAGDNLTSGPLRVEIEAELYRRLLHAQQLEDGIVEAVRDMSTVSFNQRQAT